MSQNKFAEAILILVNAKNSKPVKPSVYLHLSTAYRKLNDFDSAIGELEIYLSFIQDQQEKTIISQQLRELKKEKLLYRSSELRKKVSKSDKKVLN
jgi:regulator of sirC expression with transglutaminase-like and TPR domain